MIKLTQVQQLEQEIREYPSNVEANLRLSELYESQGRLHEAERVLSKALEITEDDRVRQRWEETAMLHARRKLTIAEQQSQASSSDDAQRAVEQARREVNDLEMDIFHSRCEREPETMAFRYEFALRLQREGNLQEAMRRFKEASEDPLVKGPATLALGGCFHQMQEIPKAMQCFRLAAAACREDQLQHKKLALYQAGSLAAAIRLSAQARRYYQQLLRIDSQYKDAAKRLQQLETV